MSESLILSGVECPFYAAFFGEVGGSSLDSHHGFVVEYGKDRDAELGNCFLWAFLLQLICSNMLSMLP